MKFIVDFYKDLETLDLIIFWGIIVVIILLLVFSIIMINKNNKLKKMVNKNNKNQHQVNNYEEIPIKKENQTKKDSIEKSLDEQKNIDNQKEETDSIILPELPKISNEGKNNQNDISNTIQTEKKFIAEEHVMEYNKDLFSLPNIQKTNEQQLEQVNHNSKQKATLKMPTGPYQRNVLREMSLSQTSPIGLTTPKEKVDKKIELAKDLESALNSEQNTEQNETILLKQESTILNKKIPEETKKVNYNQNKQPYNESYNKIHQENIKESIKYQEKNNNKENNNIIKKELNLIKNSSPRITEIKSEEKTKERYNYEERRKENINPVRPSYEELKTKQEIKAEESISILEKERTNDYESRNQLNEEKKEDSNSLNKQESIKEHQSNIIDPRVKELLNSVSNQIEIPQNKSSSEKYLEEVSRKLAEAEITDEIERTDYELEQEENAIISYKELMEKKDSIQTIDEEEAVISIEELMNRNNKKQEQNEIKQDAKLYKLTDEEENDDFIKELKQFRNDL